MTPAPADAARLPVGLAIAGAVSVGVLTALQARVNGSLGGYLGDGFAAGAVSFGSGLVIVAVISVVLPAGRAGLARLAHGVRTQSIPFWMLCGGIAGAFGVATQSLTVATIGVALFTVGLVAGQTVSGLVLDRVGFGPGGVVAITRGRLLGGLLAVLAVVVCLVGGDVGRAPAWMLVLPVLAGVFVAWQQGTNGRLRVRVQSPLTATFMNFLGGTIVLVVAAGIHAAIAGLPGPFPTAPWYYLGGALGVSYIFLSAALVRHIGVLLLGLCSVVGLLASSLALDAIWPAPAGPALPAAAAAVVIGMAGVVVAVIPWGRRRRWRH